MLLHIHMTALTMDKHRMTGGPRTHFAPGDAHSQGRKESKQATVIRRHLQKACPLGSIIWTIISYQSPGNYQLWDVGGGGGGL